MSDEIQKLDCVHAPIRKTIGDSIELDFAAAAELFPSGTKNAHGKFKYRRFETAAEAIRFAVEDVPLDVLRGAYLEVDEVRFGWVEIRNLYESTAYPLVRREAEFLRKSGSKLAAAAC